jgi:uncharacterized protein with HEPN domain
MWRDEHLLLDMLIYARQARDFNAGVTWKQFAANKQLQYATQYTLQCIGEAAYKVSKEFQHAHGKIPWDQICGLRHRLVHDYHRIELPKVWSVVENHLGQLIAALEPIVPPDESANAGQSP